MTSKQKWWKWKKKILKSFDIEKIFLDQISKILRTPACVRVCVSIEHKNCLEKYFRRDGTEF